MKIYKISKGKKSYKGTTDEVATKLGCSQHSIVQAIYTGNKRNTPIMYKGWEIQEIGRECRKIYEFVMGNRFLVGSMKTLSERTNFAVSTLYKHFVTGKPLRRKGREYYIRKG